MFKDIRDLELTIIKERPVLYSAYKSDNGKSIKYSKVSVAIIKNPYKNGKLDFAVMPYFKNDSGEFVPVYTYQEDIQYQEYRRLIKEWKRYGKYIPPEVEDFVKEIAQRKCKACEWANNLVTNALSDGFVNKQEIHFSKQVWRDTMTASDIAKGLMAEAVESLK